MAMGLGAFTEGLMGGMKARDQMDIAKQYKERLRQDNAQGAIDLQETYDLRKNEWLNNPDNKGQTEKDFLVANPGMERYTMGKDPALVRFGKFLGKKLGMFGGGQAEASMAGAAEAIPTGAMSKVPGGGAGSEKLWEGPNPNYGYVPQQSAIPADKLPSNKLVGYADGGRIPREEYQRDREGRLPDRTSHEPPRTGGRGLGEDVVNMGLDDFTLPEDRGSAFPRFHASVEKTRQYARDAGAEYAASDQGPGATGVAARKQAWAGLSGAPKALTAGAVDIADAFIPDGTGAFIEGFVTGDDGSQQGVKGGEYGIPEDFDPNMKLYPDGVPGANENEDKKAATDATAPAPARSDTDIADQAIDDGTMMALENLDFRTLTSQGLTPNDLPQMPTGEWTQYRREMMDSLIAKGKDPSEALTIVDDMTVGVQMRGFQRYGQQAAQYLMAGLQDEAAMAMSMAFQYFPNGVSVQWADFTDPKTGQAALVARGFDEETGEPRGAPQLITAERLTVMMDQFQNPDAFRTWTLDNRQLQLDVAKHKETVSHNKSMEDIYAYGNETDRIKALTDRLDTMLGGGQGGAKLTDIDRRIGELKENMKRSVMYEDDIAKSLPLQEDLLAIMSVYLQRTGFDAETVTQQVMEQYRAGREQGGTEAGIAAAMALLQQPQG